MLLCDQMQPRQWSDLPAGCQIQLQHKDHVSHTLIHGPEGSGKFSLAQVWLASVFGDSIWQLKQRSMETRSNGKPVSLQYYATHFHVVLDPTHLGTHNRAVLSDFIQDFASTGNVAQMNSLGKASYKVVVIRSADRLSYEAQCALRDIMERFLDTCRIIFLTKSVSRLMDPIVSRCCLVRVGIDDDFMISRLVQVKTPISKAILKKVVSNSKGSYRTAFNDIDCRRHGLKPGDMMHDLLTRVASNAAAGNLTNHTKVRDSLHSALVTSFNPSKVMFEVTKALMQTMPASVHGDILEAAARAEELMASGATALLCLDLLYFRAAAANERVTIVV